MLLFLQIEMLFEVIFFPFTVMHSCFIGLLPFEKLEKKKKHLNSDETGTPALLGICFRSWKGEPNASSSLM